MEQQDHNKSIKDQILESIETGKVAMKPRWHFVMRAALLIVGTVLASLALLYVVSFAVFMLRESGALFAPTFGLRGLEEFLLSLPVLFVILALVFIVVLEVLVRRYEFAHRKPLVYSVLGITLLVVIGGIVIDRVHIHEGLFRHAQEGSLPFGGPLYRKFGEPSHRNVIVGTITETTDSGFSMYSHHREVFMVVVTNNTDLPTKELVEQDFVAVFGPRQQNIIQAVGIKKLEPGTVFMMPPGPREQHR